MFGELLTGTAEKPALVFESVHYLSKNVAGVPLRRPAWWFDPAIAGEAIADVGTHLADLAMWLAFPGQAFEIDRGAGFQPARLQAGWKPAPRSECWTPSVGPRTLISIPFVRSLASPNSHRSCRT